MREFAAAVVWNRAANLYGWRALLGDRAGGEHVPPYAAPARAANPAGLPPASTTLATPPRPSFWSKAWISVPFRRFSAIHN